MYRVLTGSLSARRVALVVVEHGLVVLSLLIAVVIRLGLPENAEVTWYWVTRGIVAAIVMQICLHYADLYDMRKLADRREFLARLLRAMGAASMILAILYYLVPSLVIGRGVFALTTLLALGMVAGWRLAFEWLSERGTPTEHLLIVGTGPAVRGLASELLDRRSELGVQLVGFVDSDPASVGRWLGDGKSARQVIGTVSDIPAIVRAQGVDRVVVSLADARGKFNMDELLAMKLNDGVRFDHLASVYEEYTGKISVENLRPSWLIFSEGFRKSDTTEAVKRISDIAFALLGLTLALPLIVGTFVAIRLTSPGPALYRQRRVGRAGVPFVIYKFRSMRVDAEAVSGAVWAQQGDPRVTPLGRFLRRTRLDEIPQLWNVMRGDMSFVGPRPERPEFVEQLSVKIPYYGQRHVVRPGLTGWAQVRHRYGSSLGDAQEKLQFDLFYIKHMSFTLDLYIALETVKTVLVRGGS